MPALAQGQVRGNNALRLVYDADVVTDWVSERLGTRPGWLRTWAIGLERGGRLVAGVVYENFGAADVNMHVAAEGKHWLNRTFLARCFYYPFVECGLRRVTGLVAAKNAPAQRFVRHLGFKLEGLARHALPDDDILIFGMLRDECRYIPRAV